MPQTYYPPNVGYSNWITTSATTSNYVIYPQNTAITSTQYLYPTQVTYDPVWQTWTSNATTVQPTYANQVWQRWTDQVWSDTPVYSRVDWEALRVADERAVRSREAERLRQQEERQAARTRARVLLDEFLSDEQKGELERHGRFHVTGSRGRRYCIRTSGQQGNVDLLSDRGDVQATLCAHPGGYLPDGDAWLMQMIEIRHDEDQFLRVANVHRGRLPHNLETNLRRVA
jgi:hypothetical protein